MFSLHSVWYDGKDRSEYSVAILNLNEEKRESQNMLQIERSNRSSNRLIYKNIFVVTFQML